MKLIIFAGGVGSRFWPLSRESSPKQFDKIFDGKSTLQMAIERVAPVFGIENIFIQSLEKYQDVILEQIPELKTENIIIEPERRNLGAAVCLAMTELKKKGYRGPVSIIWADHLMQNVEEFTSALSAGAKLIEEQPERFVFLAEKARFANNNLGWMKVGPEQGTVGRFRFFEFGGWKYKPSVEECQTMFESGVYYWNPGYFITSIDFLIDLYKNLALSIYDAVSSGNYHEAEATHFDRAIIEKMDLSQAVIIKTDLGWSDPGTLYALKEALAESQVANVSSGLVSDMDCKDSLLYNIEPEKLVTAIGLEGIVVVNTKDALIVAAKEQVVKITKLLEQLKEQGLEKYL